MCQKYDKRQVPILQREVVPSQHKPGNMVIVHDDDDDDDDPSASELCL